MTSTDRLNEYASPNEMLMAKGVDGGIGQEDSFFGPVKILALAVMLASLAFGIILCFIKDVPSGLFVIVVALLCDVFLTRYIILEEKKYTKIFDESHFEEPQPVEIFDNVMRITGDNRDSLPFVYMGTGETCLVIQIQHGSIVGKGLQYEEIYYDTLSDALRMLIKNDYTVIRKQMMINCKDDPRLARLQKNEIKLNNPAVRDLMRDEIGYLASISDEVQYEQEYWFVYTRKSAQEEAFLGDVSRAVVLLRTVARLSHICTKGELYALDQREFGCPNAILGEKSSLGAFGLSELGDIGVYVSGVGLSEFTLQEREPGTYYSKAPKETFEKYSAAPSVLNVDGLIKTLESSIIDHEVAGLKDNLYAKYIVNSTIYKQSLAQSLSQLDWGDDEDEDE